MPAPLALKPLTLLGTWDAWGPGPAPAAYYHQGRIFLTGMVLVSGVTPADDNLTIAQLPLPAFYPAEDTDLLIPFQCGPTDDNSGGTEDYRGIAPIMGKTLFGTIPRALPAKLSAEDGKLRLREVPPGPWWPDNGYQYMIHAYGNFLSLPIDLTITVGFPPLVLGNLFWTPVGDWPDDEYITQPLNPLLGALRDHGSAIDLHNTRYHLGGDWEVTELPSAQPATAVQHALFTSPSTAKQEDGSPIVIAPLGTTLTLDQIPSARPRGDVGPYLYPICPFLPGWTDTNPAWAAADRNISVVLYLNDFIVTRMRRTSARILQGGAASTTGLTRWQVTYGGQAVGSYEYAPGEFVTLWGTDGPLGEPFELSNLMDPTYGRFPPTGTLPGVNVNDLIVQPDWCLIVVKAWGQANDGTPPAGFTGNAHNFPTWAAYPTRGQPISYDGSGTPMYYLINPFTTDPATGRQHNANLFEGPVMDYLSPGLRPTALLKTLAGSVNSHGAGIRETPAVLDVPEDLRPFMWRADQVTGKLDVRSVLSPREAQEVFARVPFLFGFNPPTWWVVYEVFMMPYYEAEEGLVAVGDFIDLTDTGFPGGTSVTGSTVVAGGGGGEVGALLRDN